MLLSVLLIVALLSAITVRMMSRHSLTIAQARQSLGADLTLSYALGAETLARQLLFRDWEADEAPKNDTLFDEWAQPLQPFELAEYDNAFLEIQIADRGSCFNLNAMAHTEQQKAQLAHQQFRRLLQILELPPNMADTWKDWVDADELNTGFGAEDNEYLLKPAPYRAANRPAADISELRLLANLDPQQRAAVAPFVCVLPTTDLLINLNTAPWQVLASLNEALTPSFLEPLVRGERRYESVNEVTGEYPELQASIENLAVESEYFELRAQVDIDGNLTEISSLLFRNGEDGRLSLVRRDLGQPFVSLYEDDGT
ncbi:MAG: type II secretion system minor pseudopilin GspK [Pseudomonadota bacterium]